MIFGILDNRLARRLLFPLYRCLKWSAKRWKYRGKRFYCPVCDSHVSRFLPHGLKVRQDAMCPICESMERHRLYRLYYKEKTKLTSSAFSMLHFAPEMGLEERFSRLPHLRRVSSDLLSRYVDVKSDILQLPFRDGSFDIVHCSHVLEHVSDDRLALRELRRVLRPGGWGLIQVPIWSTGSTEEDPTVTDPRERQKLYGQHDHVRLYGRDFLDRIEQAGFRVSVVSAEAILGPGSLRRMGIPSDEEIFHCEVADRTQVE